MKKLIMIISLMMAFSMMAVSAVMASTITLTQNSYSYSNGGEFTATPSVDLAWLLNNYNAKAKIGGGFETFCVEYTEHFNPGGTYNASISDRAMNGGVVPAGTGDPVSIGTAYLYSQFAQGILSGYFSGDRKTNAGQLQLAIWWLEDEYTLSTAEQTSNLYLQMVNSMFANAKADANGAYGVGVLNLTTVDANGEVVELNQDQLTYDTVPEPATMLLFGLGLLGLAGIRRKFKG